MKPNKKIETAVLEVYDTWLYSYLNGDVQTYDKYLDDEYHFIGSTNNEEFLSRKETTQFFADTAAQLAGKCDLRKEFRTIEQFGELIIITHAFDAWFFDGKKSSYYGRFRFTSTLRKNKEGWRFIYQHFSTPDSNTGEGETIGFEKINEENKELREGIKRRTFELEQKNRELEVEGALQRIRAQATAMRQSTDLLDVVVAMRTEFINLGHEAHYFWHMLWSPDTYEKAMTSGDGTRIGFVMKLPRHIHGDIPLVAKWEKSEEPTVVYPMNVDAALAYIDKMVRLGDFQHIDPQAPTEDDIGHIGGLTFIMARTTHGEIGYSLPGVVTDPPAEDLDILVRFAGAFDLAHLRFLDLKKAEAQAREVQIELALEKVRSRSMAMHKSEELADLSLILVDQVQKLGISTWFCAFNIYDDGEKSSLEWGSNGQNVFPKYRTPREGIFLEYYEAGQSGETFLIKEIDEEACPAHYDYLCSLPGVGEQLLKMKDAGISFPTSQIDHVAFFKYGYILFITFDQALEAHNIFKRFAKVFEQTYTRFLDLQKAEAQALEAKIEHALEKVRSRTMAMQKSDELAKVATAMFKEFHALNLATANTRAIINIINEENGDAELWLTTMGGNEINSHFKYNYNETEQWKSEFREYQKIEKLKRKEYKYVNEFEGEDFDGLLAFGLEQNIMTQDEIKTVHVNGIQKWIEHNVWFSHGSLTIGRESHLSEIGFDTFQRFAAVFEQTYIRFLDLQKAEEQKREAQIEVALERIRASAMAMHISQDIMGVAEELRNQMSLLGQPELESCIIQIYDEKKGQFEGWWVYESLRGSEKKVIKGTSIVPFNQSTWTRKVFKHYKSSKKEYTIESKGKMLKDWYHFLEDIAPETIDYDSNNRMVVPEVLFYHFVKFSGGALLVISEDPPGVATKNLQKRAANVFNLAFKRFLDLQKAETQVREAQIEAALEKVRSRSLAMHKSDELKEVATELYSQILNLGFEKVDSGGFIFPLPEENVQKCWFTETDNGLLSVFEIPYKGDLVLQERIEAHKNNKLFLEQSLKGKKLQNHMDIVLPQPYRTFEEEGAVKSMPSYTIFNMAFFKNGYINLISHEKLSKGEQSILIRFAKVFEQTYTRFLDLEKAETQAKEAQIEVALERVRAASMAMHKSEQSLQLVNVLFDQVKNVGIPIESSWITLVDTDLNTLEYWIRHGDQEADAITVNAADHPQFDETIKAFEDKIEVVSMAVPKSLFLMTLKELFGLDVLDRSDKSVFYFLLIRHRYGNIGLGTWEEISRGDKVICQRFASVFEQTYTRFLDLQKAEAQAREAHIEAALERVRSRSMAMHKSEELKDVVSILFQGLNKLRIALTSGAAVAINIYLPGQDKMNVYVCGDSDHGLVIHNFVHPYSKIKVTKDLFNCRKQQLELFVGKYSKRQKDTFYKHLFKNSELGDISNEIQAQILETKSLIMTAVTTEYFVINVMDLAGKGLSEDEGNILKRFSSVFNQAYTRFLDLQKAESQAREAQIEGALERVRAASMAMHSSDGLLEVTHVLREQMAQLGEKELESIVIHLYSNTDTFEAWYSYLQQDGDNRKLIHDKVDLSWTCTARMRKDKELYQGSESDYTLVADRKLLKEWYQYIHDIGAGVVEFDEKEKMIVPDSLYYNYSKFSAGALLLVTNDAASEHAKHLLRRATDVFNQAYTRFLDLQKAESQAREAQIEAALERVRASTMAMHHTNELADATNVLFDQITTLGIEAVSGWISIVDAEADTMNIYLRDEKLMRVPTLVSGNNHSNFRAEIDSWKGGDEFIKIRNPKNEFIRNVKKIFGTKVSSRRDREHFHLLQVHHKYGFLGLGMWDEANEDEYYIYKRFAKVFEQTYTRFLDLQKAEAQALEAKIEHALEKVRSRTMAMQKSEELPEAANNLFLQVQELGIPAWSAGYCIFSEDKESAIANMSSEGVLQKPFRLPNIGVGYDFQKPMENGEYFHVGELGGETIVKHYEFMRTLPVFGEVIDGIIEAGFPLPTFQIFHIVYFKYGYVMFITYEAVPDAHDIFKRFGKVFEQTYTRFLDLQKAEAQAREAQIEAALEKVRSRSLAMRKPDELQEVVAVVAEKLKDLGVIFDAGGVILCTYFPDNKDVVHWIAVDDFSSSGRYLLPYFDNPIFSDAWDSKSRGDSYFSQKFSVAAKDSFFEYAFEHSDYRYMPEEYKQFVLQAEQHHLSAAWAKNSAIIIPSLTGVVPSESDAEIMKRFAGVFEQAYIRFIDLQKAEKRTRESQIDIALERVRSRTLEMQKSEELAETSAVLFQQINDLVPKTWSCGFCIWQENDEVELWMGADSGGLLPPMRIPYKKEPTHKDIYQASLGKDSVYHKIWKGKALKNHYSFLGTIPSVAKAIKVMEDSGLTLPNQQCYYVGFFKHGYLLLITKEPNDDLIELSKRFTNVFDLTYTRFLDLQLKEKQSVALLTEKQRLEKTLNDLQATQAQLIQAEKMASLGELTAGIAHEIKNPLNFVNNFSEVNAELADELLEALTLRSGSNDFEEEIEIATDIKSNQEKILHHGQRADSIVNNMLQHSRTSSGEKELTDINALADEYLRLAYHGLRAKDSNFNSKMETDFDEEIGKLNVIPQDFGRVLLNLITNAFQACAERSRSTVNERQQLKLENYEPNVKIKTQRKSNSVEIIVSDNGSGIPDNIKDKIFQPFFTTKPTGEGTGLGLSMSYDIVMAHGGELKVESEENQGSVFELSLPINDH